MGIRHLVCCRMGTLRRPKGRQWEGRRPKGRPVSEQAVESQPQGPSGAHLDLRFVCQWSRGQLS